MWTAAIQIMMPSNLMNAFLTRNIIFSTILTQTTYKTNRDSPLHRVRIWRDRWTQVSVPEPEQTNKKKSHPNSKEAVDQLSTNSYPVLFPRKNK